MKKITIVLFLYLGIVGCYSNKECKESENIPGDYILDTMLLKQYNYDTIEVVSLMRKNKWEKIVLIAEKNKYFFKEDDGVFRRYEGEWELKESGRDGDCHMYIYQKEYSRKIGLDPFNISVEINNKLVVLPFRKKNKSDSL